MPYVSITTNTALSQQQKQLIKSGMGKLITLIPGKSEQSLMVAVEDERFMSFRGQEIACAFVQVYTYKHADTDAMGRFIEQAGQMLEATAGIPAANIYIAFSGHDRWGSGGNLLT